MPIGVGAAMLIGSAVAGGTALGAAKLQSNAAGKAQKDQQAATDRALAVQQQQTAPYRALGEQAAGRLSAPQPDAYRQAFTGPGGSNGFQAFQPPPQGPSGGSLAGLGQPGMGQPLPGAVPRQQGMQGPPMMGGGQGQMVQLQGPDGSVKPFPAAQVPQILAAARAKGHQVRVVG